MARTFGLNLRAEDRRATLNDISGLAGRTGISIVFIASAHHHLTVGWTSTIAQMVARGVPMPEAALTAAMAISSLAAVAVVLDIKTQWAAWVLAGYSVFVSYVMYDPFATAQPSNLFFLFKDLGILAAKIPPKEGGNVAYFLKDLAIAGGLLAYASARYSSKRADAEG